MVSGTSTTPSAAVLNCVVLGVVAGPPRTATRTLSNVTGDPTTMRPRLKITSPKITTAIAATTCSLAWNCRVSSEEAKPKTSMSGIVPSPKPIIPKAPRAGEPLAMAEACAAISGAHGISPVRRPKLIGVTSEA